MKNSTVTLMGKKIKVKSVEGLLSNAHIYGQYEHRQKTIQLDLSLKGDIQLQTLLHEFIHAFCHIANFHQMPCWSINVEELLAEGLSDALLENFKLSKR